MRQGIFLRFSSTAIFLSQIFLNPYFAILGSVGNLHCIGRPGGVPSDFRGGTLAKMLFTAACEIAKKPRETVLDRICAQSSRMCGDLLDISWKTWEILGRGGADSLSKEW
jgi:hypothetical protein